MGKKELGVAAGAAPFDSERASSPAWKVCERRGSVHIIQTNAVGDAPEVVTSAAHIVHCLEAHDDLLAALEMAMPALEWCDKQWAKSPQRGEGVNVLAVVRAAISKATKAT